MRFRERIVMTSNRFWSVGTLCLAVLSLLIYFLVQPGEPIKVPPSAADPAPSSAGRDERAAMVRRKGYVQVPLQLTNYGYLNFAAQVNDESWLFFLDTGAGSTDAIVDKLVPERHKLATQPSGMFASAVGGKTQELPKIVMDRFAVGGVQQQLDATVMDFSEQNRDRLARNEPLPDGLLGANFLARYVAVIDYDTASLFLWPQDPNSRSNEKPQHNPAGSELAALLKAHGYHEVPLVPCKNKLFCVDAQIHGEHVRLQVDTGSMASLMDPTAVDRLRLPVEQSENRVQGAVGRDETGKKTTIPILIGSIETPLEAYVVDESTPNAALQNDGDAPYDGVLGAPILRQFAAVIDYGSAKLFLREPKPR
jgi:predicted aspartyl protease